MIRRWGFITFFLLALLLSAGAWVGSYWWYAIEQHNSIRTGAQEVLVVWGSVHVIFRDGWPGGDSWRYWYKEVDPKSAAVLEKVYQTAPYRFLGCAFNPAEELPTGAVHRLIIPLYFPTLLSALGLLWAWRRKRRIDRMRRGGFEVQPSEGLGA